MKEPLIYIFPNISVKYQPKQFVEALAQESTFNVKE